MLKKATPYLISSMAIIIVTAVDFYLFNHYDWLSYQAVGLTQLWIVLLVAVYLGRRPAILVAIISTLSWTFLFITPVLTLNIGHLQDLILCVLYFATAIFTGGLTARIKEQEQQERRNVEHMSALYRLTNKTATAYNLDDGLKTALKEIQYIFDADVIILIPKDKKLETVIKTSANLTDVDVEAAQFAYETKEITGRFTKVYSGAFSQYHPLLTPTRIIGVIGIHPRHRNHLDEGQYALLETFISHIALFIERDILNESAKQTAMLEESGRLYNILLNSISHELRTPLSTIKGASSILLKPQMSKEVQFELANDIQIATDRLNKLVENLLDMSRLESGHLQLKSEWCDITDVIGVAVKGMNDCSVNHTILIDVETNLPLVKIDFALIEQTLSNLLDNACRYTPEGSLIRIETNIRKKLLNLIISDNGTGIPDELLERIFDKFYRVPGTGTGGTGLGLSISRGLIEAHGGTLTAENNLEGGLRFILTLPISETPPSVREACDE